MNLQSPLFDKVRIPSRQTISRVIERVCFEHGADPEGVRLNRHRYPSDQALAVRRAILTTCRDAGYAPANIADWFHHGDSRTIVQWLADMDEFA